MTTLATQFQILVDTGVLTPTENAPRFEPLYRVGHFSMRTVYDLGEVVIRGESRDAKLGAGSRRNTDARR